MLQTLATKATSIVVTVATAQLLENVTKKPLAKMVENKEEIQKNLILFGTTFLVGVTATVAGSAAAYGVGRLFGESPINEGEAPFEIEA